MESFARGNGGTREVGILGDIGNPRRLAARPNPAGEALPRMRPHLQASGLEFLEVGARRVPRPPAPQHPMLPIDQPQGTEVPPQAGADGFQDRRSRPAKRPDLRQDPRDLVLGEGAEFLLLALRDVPGDGRSAGDDPAGVPEQ